MTAPHRPVLRYHGGKWLLAPWIIENFGPHRVYVEPFGGAASVLIRKEQSYAEIYNDLDKEVVGLFRVLQDRTHSAHLLEKLRGTPFARTEFERAYEVTEDPVESARRLIIRSFMGFGSPGALGRSTGFRASSNRSGTTPAHDWNNYPDALRLIIDRLKRCVIECRPAMQVMEAHAGPDTLFFVDPPYLPETRSGGNPHCVKHKYRFEMDEADHRELLDFMLGLEGMVVLCGYPSALYTELLPGWVRKERAALADGARARTECLWLNPAAHDALAQQDMFTAAGEAA